MTKDSILNKIQKLLNMTTERGCTQPEAENAAAQVQRLLFKYKLSMAEVEAADPDEKQVNHITEQSQFTGIKKNEGRWRSTLAHKVARYNFCNCLQSHRGLSVYFIGTETDIEVVKELYFWIIEQLEELCRQALMDYEGPDRAPTFRRAFFESAVMTIGNRLYREREALKEESEMSTALVLKTDEMLKGYMDRYYPKLRHARFSSTSSWDGSQAGHAAGEQVNINRPAKKLGQTGQLRGDQ